MRLLNNQKDVEFYSKRRIQIQVDKEMPGIHTVTVILDKPGPIWTYVNKVITKIYLGGSAYGQILIEPVYYELKN
jgi:hypothetical protein